MILCLLIVLCDSLPASAFIIINTTILIVIGDFFSGGNYWIRPNCWEIIGNFEISF